MGMLPNDRERRLAKDEAADAIEKRGAQAADILLMRAQQTRSSERRMIYNLARKIVLGRD